MELLKNSFYAGLRHFPVLYSGLRWIFHQIIVPLRNGRLLYWIYYFIFIRKNEINRIQQLGFENITPFDHNNWRIGEDEDRAYRRFYLGFMDGEKCFIKIGKHDKTVKNETEIQEKLRDKKFDFTPKCILINKKFDMDTVLIAVEYVDGLHKIPENIDTVLFQNICNDFLQIYQNMVKNELVHADIHRGNLMLNSQNRLVLLDFGISKFMYDYNNINYIERPGTFYRKKGNYRIYDDAYSFIKMMQSITLPETVKKVSSFSSITALVDNFYLEIDTGGK